MSRSLFSSRDFRLLLAGQTTSQLGTQISGVAVPLLAVGVLHASAFEVGLLGAASTLAFAVIGLPAGAWLDRLRRRPVLIASDILRAVLLATIPVTAWLGVLTITQLLAVALLTGVARVFFDVGYQSYLPSLVGRDRVLAGNSVMELVRSSGQITGPGIGGVLVSLVGAANVVLAQAITFAVSALTLQAIRTPEQPPVTDADTRRTWARAAEGVRFVVGNRVLRATAIASAASNLSFAIASAVTIIFLSRDLGQPAWMIGTIIAVGSVAAMAGAALTPRAASLVGSVRIVWLCLVVTGPLGLLIVLASPGWGVLWAIAGIAAGELGQIVYAIANLSLRQRICPEHILARTNATMRVAIMGLFPLGAIAGGTLGEVIGARWTLLVAGCVALLAPVALVRALHRHRDIDDLVPDPDVG